ncbi:unnamed protein product [Dimorphilus gyrociliatus]|uniref:Uncharacterized protein n=1 Tax=Dimorphilus gyrociliatus TaxID=2664684 RepID=A0A7I8W8B4_9ANNE|nr:unnamed protein product [Dimorphilus gyrociliatus]
MTVERGGAVSPVHVHVAEDTAVHVHVKKRLDSSHSKSDVRRAIKEREHGWIPPPAKSSIRSRCLASSEPAPGGPRVVEVSTEEEDNVRVKMHEYESRVGELVSEVGSLKAEVALERSLRKETDDVAKSKGKEALLHKLVSVELDATASIRHADGLRDVMRRFRDERKLCGSDWNMINKQRDLLVSKLGDFERGARILVSLLHETHDSEAATHRLIEQRDLLLHKLAKAEEALSQQERTMQEVHMTAEAQKDENLALSGAQTALETTRAHLQKAFKAKEADCNRLAVQVRTLESDLATARLDLEYARNMLASTREKYTKNKEALKKATRVQKERANTSEQKLQIINEQVTQRDADVMELKTENELLRKEKSALDAQVTALHNRLLNIEQDTKVDIDRMEQREREAISRERMSRMEYERAETEIHNARESLGQAERLLEEYKQQLKKAREEADDALSRLEEEQRLTAKLQKECGIAVQEVRSRVQQRLAQLEPVPELLKATELKLADVSQKLNESEKKENELKSKLHQTSQHRQIQNDVHVHELSNVERRVRELEARNVELQSSLAQRDETVHRIQVQLEERSKEVAGLSRQLETAVTESRRITEQARQKSCGKERAAVARISELEAELSAARAEVARVRRERDESERKMNSKLYDLKERLEQSTATNRSMHNYVNFLKTSYANTFGDMGGVSGNACYTPSPSTF